MGVRQIPIHNRSVTGKISVPGTFTSVRTESRLESDFVLFMQFNPEVESIEGQPVRIDYVDATGKARRYTPDFLVRFTDTFAAPWLVEVKYQAHMDKYRAEYAERFAVAHQYAEELGWHFKTVTDRDLHTPLLTNIRFLMPFQRIRGDHPMQHYVLSQLKKMRLTTPRDLLGAITPLKERQAQVLPALWQLVALRRILVDLDEPLGMVSPIWSADDRVNL